jgi:LacI family transcriptional regulator
MNERKRPTIIDVAAAAGVGASTVSRYVRGAKSVSTRVSKRIEAAVAQLGYEPNALARGLRVGRTKAIGVLFPHVANIFYANALQAIKAEAHRMGFTVLLLTHNEDQRVQETQLAALKRFQCDGIILIAAAGTDEEQVSVAVGGTPLVALDRPLGKAWDSVTLHNYTAARQATEHLLWHGHRQIVAITAPYQLDTLTRRRMGYQNALERSGLSPLVVTWQTPEQLLAELLMLFSRRRAPVTAVLSLSYSITVGTLRTLRDGGFALRDKAFAAIDDLEFATLLDPQLTTLAQPAERLAQLAIDRLLHRIEGGSSAVTHARLGGKLIVRESCGCSQPETAASGGASGGAGLSV